MPEDNDILARELGKLGGLGGGLGGGLFAGLGGSIGARLAAKFLPTETRTERITLQTTPEKAIRLGFFVLTKLGRLEAGDNEGSPYPLLKATVWSGYLNMNPAVVYLEILGGGSDTCEVTITAAAKEGLIKQRTADKAIQRVASEITKHMTE